MTNMKAGRKYGRYVLNSRGAVMIIGLLLLTIMFVLGSLMSRNMATEVTISGNYETTTKSLLIAEGGLEIVKGQVKTQASLAFSASGYTSANTQQFLNGNTPLTTITNPMNWIGSTVWYTTLDTTTMALSTQVTGANTTWPIYQKVAVGSDYAVVGLERPVWMASSPTKVKLNVTSQTDNVSNSKLLNRKVAGVIEVDLGNNFLSFQAFTNPTDQQTFLDNKANNSVVIGIGKGHSLYAATEYDLGIDTTRNVITGIGTYTNVYNTGTTAASPDKTLIIRKCTDATYLDCYNFGRPEVNTSNGTNDTFILGKYSAGSTAHGCLYGYGGVAPVNPATALTISASDRYMVYYDSSDVPCP